MDVKQIAGAFFEPGGMELTVAPYGNGHINDTYLLALGGKKYLLQRINERVFKEPLRLMENIRLVTEYLLEKAGGERSALRIIKTLGGDLLYIDGSSHWRMFHFIENSFSYDMAEDSAALEKAGRVFGKFLSLLADFPADKLYESIPGFHDTAGRLAALEAACAADSHKRAKTVSAELEFCRARAAETGLIKEMLADGRLPLRVTHNDTKLNNALFDIKTGEALCVIDLDTVMPGSVLYDFGDAIRSGASLSAEDETDLSKAGVSIEYFEAFSKGFLAEQTSLTDTERELLPLGARMMCLECGIRFLTDYLCGDVYFKTSRPGQNLDRCRTQFKMVEDLEKNEQKIRGILVKCLK